jgi:O-antigen/teichoic acid export membrane protein
VFGGEFVGAAHLLRVLSLGQLVNCATGLGGYMLKMSHQERLALWILGISAALMAVAIVVLGQMFSVNGVAWATALGLAGSNLALWVGAQLTIRRMPADRGLSVRPL